MGNKCFKADPDAIGPASKQEQKNRKGRQQRLSIQSTQNGSVVPSQEAVEVGSVQTDSIFNSNRQQSSHTMKQSKHMSNQPVLSNNLTALEEVRDDDSDKGNMLNDLDNGNLSFDGEEEKKEGDRGQVDMTFACGEDARNNLNRLTNSFNIAKSRSLNAQSTLNYVLNPQKRENEAPLEGVGDEAYQKALFYMYGACESLEEEQYIVHNLLRKYQVWNGSADEVHKYLSKQLVVALEEDDQEDLESPENLVRFLNKHSNLGKQVREVEEVGETLSAKLFKIVGMEDELVVKVPKRIENEDEVAFCDLVYQTQLMQFLKDNRTDGMKQFFPSVHEEVFVVNRNTRTLLNYVAFVDFAQSSLISMLDGPTAGTRNLALEVDEEGFRSQEIFTEEKFAYLYYKGLLLLEFLYDNGMTHGHINANSLRISDDYTFTLSDFPISTVTPSLASLGPEEQAAIKMQVRGFNKETVSSQLLNKLNNLLVSQSSQANAADQNVETAAFGHEFTVRELVLEDWRDMVATFFFPKLSQVLTEPRLRKFIDDTNRELLEPGQEAAQIKNIAAKAHRFVMSNIWILEQLIETLKAEQMFEAVDSIGYEIQELGTRMENPRLQAFAQLTLGEIASQEHLESQERAEQGIEMLLAANRLYQEDASLLSTEEFSRLCLALSTLYRSAKKDTSQAKRWLELATGKITDKRVLLTFYMETAKLFTQDKKHYQALDSNKKAMDLAKQIYRDDDYAMFELQMTLAESYEACDEREQAEAIFNECFAQLDGRDGQSVYSRGMSIRSKLSKALSIKSRGTSLVMYGQRRISQKGSLSGARDQNGAAKEASQEKAGAMQRIAVQLRQKQEYGRAEKLMLKAIHVKKQLIGSELSEDIAYLYNELAVTYHGNDDYENAVKCVKKQLAIWDGLNQDKTLEYAQVLCFLGEIYRDLEQPADAILALDRGIRLHEVYGDQVAERQLAAPISQVSALGKDQMSLERTGIMITLAEEQIKNGQVSDGIASAEGALFLQKEFYSNMINFQVQETMLLLAEAYTVDSRVSDAIKVYQDILDARQDNFGALSGESCKDIYRKLAPLFAQKSDFEQAASALQKVIDEETQEILKVGLFTKMAGNLKKAGNQEECIKASRDAYDLMLRLSSQTDPQTCRCQLNLAQVLQYFEKTQEAVVIYKQLLTLFEQQSAPGVDQPWSEKPEFCRLRDFAQTAVDEIEGTGEEEYYDEEDAAELE